MNHDNLYAEHFRATRMMVLICQKYFQLELNKDVKEYVKNYDVYQRTKVLRYYLYGLLQLLLTLTHPWRNILIDMIIGLPSSTDSKGNAYDAILIIVNHFTKMAKYFPIREMIVAPQLAELFYNKIVKQYGTLRSIIIDRRSIFTSKYQSTLCYYMKTKCKLSTAFHL